MYRWFGSVCILVGCGGDGKSDVVPDGGLSGETGAVTVIARPDTRVDFMSGDFVRSTARTDENGRIEAQIADGDRAVIVTRDGPVVLDALRRGSEYWFQDNYYPQQVIVDISWSAVPNAVAYLVQTRCGYTATSDQAHAVFPMCVGGDDAFIAAMDAQGQLLATANHAVPQPASGQPIIITEAFKPVGQTTFSVDVPADIEMIQSLPEFMTPQGALLSLSLNTQITTRTFKVPLPDAPGNVTALLTAKTAAGRDRYLRVQRAPDSNINLDLVSTQVMSFGWGNYDPASHHVSLEEPMGDGRPELVSLAFSLSIGGVLTVLEPYEDGGIAIPSLPPDLGSPVVLLGTNVPSFVVKSANGGGYETTLQEWIGRQGNYTLHFTAF